jgi:hypothetical protein
MRPNSPAEDFKELAIGLHMAAEAEFRAQCREKLTAKHGLTYQETERQAANAWRMAVMNRARSLFADIELKKRAGRTEMCAFAALTSGPTAALGRDRFREAEHLPEDTD